MTSIETLSNSASPAARKFLAVSLAGEGYCLPVSQVREIIRYQKVTPVPRLPEHIRGVLNLRGRIIPVLDLRARFALPLEVTERTCIVVVTVPLAADRTGLLGLVVDGVDEVATVKSQDFDPTPAFGAGVRTEYLLGIAKVAGGVRMLLNIDRIFEGPALAATDTAIAAA